MNRTLLLSTAGAALLAGCASSSQPSQRAASTEASIRAAREIGAQQTPDAALHLRLAEEQLETARRLIHDGSNERAEWILARAQNDAEVAIALARESAARAEARDALERVRQTRAQLGATGAANEQGGVR